METFIEASEIYMPFSHIFPFFCITIWLILPYVLMIFLDGCTYESGSIFQLALL